MRTGILRNHWLPLLVGIVLSSAAVPVGAIVFEHNDQVHITNLHRISDDLYSFGENLTVDGVIDGELTAFASNARIAGNVTGSANLFAYEAHIPGQVDGSLRIFAQKCEIDGFVGQSALLFCQSFTLDRSGVIGRSAAIYGETVGIFGSIGIGSTRIAGKYVTIEGEIGGDLHVSGEMIIIASSAVIDGNLTYSTKLQDNITIEDGATIAGEVTWSPPELDEEDSSSATMTSIVLAVSKLFAAFLFGIIVVAVFGRYAEESFRQLHTRFTVSIATGVVSALALVFMIIVLSMSLILLIAGLLVSNPVVSAMLLVFSILMVPITTFFTVAGGIVFYSGKIVLGFLIGAIILRRTSSPAALNRINLLIGLVLLTILFEIPYIGFVAYLLVAVAGAGAIVLGIRHCPREHGRTAAVASGPTASATPQGSPPPPGPPPPEPPPRPSDLPGSDH